MIRVSRSLVPASVTILIVGIVTGCHNNYDVPLPKPQRDVPNARLRVVLQTSPTAIRQMDPTTFTIYLRDARNRPVKEASVTADLVMPAMDMGKNAVALHPQGVGVYTGVGRFSMDGDWRVIVTARHGTDLALQAFPIRVR